MDKKNIFENFMLYFRHHRGFLPTRKIELIDSLLNSDILIEKESRLYSVIEMLIRGHSNCEKNILDSKKSNSAVRRVREYIDNNFMDEISLSDLSRLSGVSPFHLNRLFCGETGISPHAYQIHRRIVGTTPGNYIRHNLKNKNE